MSDRKTLRKIVRRQWGQRCDYRCPNCALCKAWDAYDYLTNSDAVQPECCPEGCQ